MIKSCVKGTEILLPKNVDMNKWACIACDQFTSQPEYWAELERTVAGKPTTLDMYFPEIYLNDNPEERIKFINSNMQKYLNSGVLQSLNPGMILTVRSTPFVERRIGIICAVDLEAYDWTPGSGALIRATEGTIEERIPPRLKIRKDADLEFPHVMVLFDDERLEIAENLYENRSQLKKIYDFDLNMGGGKIEGYFIEDYQPVIDKFLGLLDSERLIAKYGKDDKFLFAVGDGNHSLATAKAHWNSLKETLSEAERESHPARYALVELNNIYDEGIYFRPIYRFVYGIDRVKFLAGLKNVDGGKIRAYSEGKTEYREGKNSLPAGIRAVDGYIKEFIAANGGEVDYVHGDDDLKELVDARQDAVGIMFEEMDKSELFKYVSASGALPRKTFSMGEGIEKRYYLEGRRIK